MKLVNIKKDHSIILKNNITNFLTPNYVYLKIHDNSKISNHIKEYINKNTHLFDNVYSPISGNAIGIKKLNSQKYLVVKNDFKEKIDRNNNSYRDLNKLDKDKFLKLLDNYDENISKKIKSNFKKIIINDIDSSVYSGNFIFVNLNYDKEILDMIDYLLKVFDIKDCNLLLKETDFTSINHLNNIIGMYPLIKFKFLPDKYLISNELILKDYINLGDEYLYMDVLEIYDLYNYIVKKKNKEEKLLTITGDAIETPCVVNIKYATSLKEVVKNIVKITSKDYIVFKNNILYPKEIKIDDTVLDDDVNVIFIMKKQYIEEEKCINCGKCNEVCPVKINIHRLVNNKNCDISKCIKCGLCSYICPSRININKLIGDNDE